jgi:hypothetical protein
MNTQWHDLIQRYISGTITEAETQALEQQLKTDAALRDWYLDAVNLDSALQVTAEAAELAVSLPVPASQKVLTQTPSDAFRWLAWRPLTAAAAAMLFGMFCNSMVFGFGSRYVEKVVSLLQESFESGPAPLVKGMPKEVNQWSGDFSEIVENCEEVKPAHGTKMLRVLRSDFEGKGPSEVNVQGDLWRIIDVRQSLREANGAEVVITLSAKFNAMPFPDMERYDGGVRLFALGQLGAATPENISEDALAHSGGSCRSMDRDPATWQSASARLLLPPETEFVMLKVFVRRWPKGSETLSSLPNPIIFSGHFVDDVRVSIRIRNPVPNQRN